jgi:tripartite-type tricarboxylate transporter receptor subunit TctC
MTPNKYLATVALTVATIASTPLLAQAQTSAPAPLAHAWPDKPVRIVVPAPAGSSLDVIVRTLGDKLKDAWKQPIVVENKPGAGGMLGMDVVAKAAPDGHTLGIGFNGPIAFGPSLYKKMPYAPGKDLLPIVLTTSQPNVLAVPANHPAKDAKEFVAWAKAGGNKLSYGSVGNGSSSHLSMELFKSVAGFDGVHVPYNGSPPAAQSLAGSETQALFAVASGLMPLLQGGRIKFIAVTGAKRLESLPDVPTVAEAGYPNFEALAWNGLFAPAGTPDAVVARINADVNAALRDASVRDAFAKQGLVMGGGTAASFKSYIDAEAKKWGDTIRAVGVTLD